MTSPILETFALGSQWPMFDPFLFCAHHRDDYPAGDGRLAPNASVAGRTIGSDFSGRDGWSMYHGSRVPGFPQHPHRGFETISYVRQGWLDHADSLGATARLSDGDVQWMTAGAGVQHSEMFPLVSTEGPNRLEMFQIWLNLPAEDKLVDPYFTMLWQHAIPTLALDGVRLTAIAGQLAELQLPKPPVNSWAARSESDVALWHVVLSPGASFALPAANFADTTRALYAFHGAPVELDGGDGEHHGLAASHGARLACQDTVTIHNGDGSAEAEVLVIQGRPIGEPIVQHGPFVMNTEAEIRQTMVDYQRTQFGGWPWPSPDPNHGPDKGRFAIHADGRYDEPAA